MEARKFVDPELHQHRFLSSLSSAADIRKLRGPRRDITARGQHDIQWLLRIPFYRFEGVDTLRHWSISDNFEAWPMIDELRQLFEQYEAERRAQRKGRKLKGLIEQLISKIEMLSCAPQAASA